MKLQAIASVDDPSQILSEADFRMKKRQGGFYRKLSNISGYGGIVVKTFDTETANEGEEEDVEIIKNLKFYKKTRHYRQLQLADGDAAGDPTATCRGSSHTVCSAASLATTTARH